MAIIIPKEIVVGGQKLKIELPEKLNNNRLGQCCVAAGYIRIAKKFNCSEGDVEQSDSSKVNTFYHEITHAILETMDRQDLDSNEEFVSTFASFLCGAMSQFVELEFTEE